jgi:hypothetical protein
MLDPNQPPSEDEQYQAAQDMLLKCMQVLGAAGVERSVAATALLDITADTFVAFYRDVDNMAEQVAERLKTTITSGIEMDRARDAEEQTKEIPQ